MSKSITKYRVNYSREEINKVEVLRETECCVFLASLRPGRPEYKVKKITTGDCYFDEPDAALAFITLYHESAANRARLELERATIMLGKITQMGDGL